MDIKYEDYLGAGTKKLLEFLSSSDVNEGERDAIVSAFSSELSKNIGDTGKLQNYELLIYNASIKYIDGEISKVLAKPNASFSDYEKAIRLCERERDMLQLFAVKKWSFPELSNPELEKCEETLRKRKESTSISSKITEEDCRIDELTKVAQTELSVKICDSVIELLDELANDISICKQKKIPIPSISNKDTKKAKKRMVDLRTVAEQKEALHQNIYGVDLQIHSIVSLPKTSPEQWQEVIALCQKQTGLLSECNKKQWQLPSVRYSTPGDVANKYKHFQAMGSLDKAISSNRSTVSSGKQYKIFFDNCAQQQRNIETCRKNNWELPDIVVTDPAGLAKVTQDEKNKKDKAKKLKINFILVGVASVVFFVLVLLGIHNYRDGKVQIPFDASYVSGENLDMIYDELKTAGLKNIEKKQDSSGWLDSNEVLSVTIDNQDSYSKGSYKEPDVSVVITYSSAGRIYVTDLLKDWKKTDYRTIVDALKKTGFTNVFTEEVDTSDKEKDQLVSALLLNGEKYTNEHCYLPKNAPITVSYYSLKIGIGNGSAEFIGQDYETVVEDLRESSFTNVHTEQINTGWAKGKTVVGVTVNNVDTYDSSESFAPDVKIVVKYSSDNRADATSALKSWSTKDYEALQTSLRNKGFTNVTVKEKNTYDKYINHLAASVTISNELFKSGDCFVQKNATIVIEYYAPKIKVGQTASSFANNKKGEYSDAVTKLKNMGFTNIQLYRKNDLGLGWFTKEGSIDSISIDGNSSFSETDSFYYDAPVVIVVHTFKNKGCDDIKEVAK